MMTQLARLASAVINCGRQFTGQYLVADCVNRVENMVTQFLREFDPDTAFRSTIPYEAVRNINSRHVLETQGPVRKPACLPLCRDARLTCIRQDRRLRPSSRLRRST